MRVLVTGGSGFVGRCLVAALRARGDDVLSAAPSLGADEHIPLDLTDADNVRAVVELARADLVFHLAAQTFVPASIERPVQTYRTNVDGTVYLTEALRALRDDGGPDARLIFTSSAEVYGRRAPAEMPLRETLATQPANPYAASKVAGESVVLAAHAAYRIDAVIGRAFNHIGPGQDERFAVAGFAHGLARVALGRERILSIGNLESERDFLDVRDVVRAYLALAESGKAGEVYNVCSGTATPMREMLRRLVAVARVAVEIREDPARMRPSDVPRYLGDSAKLREATGWSPSIDLGESLRDIYDDALARETALAGSGETTGVGERSGMGEGRGMGEQSATKARGVEMDASETQIGRES